MLTKEVDLGKQLAEGDLSNFTPAPNKRKTEGDFLLDFDAINSKYSSTAVKKSGKTIDLRGYFGGPQQPFMGSEGVFRTTQVLSNEPLNASRYSNLHAIPEEEGWVPPAHPQLQELDKHNQNLFSELKNAEAIRDLNMHRLGKMH